MYVEGQLRQLKNQQEIPQLYLSIITTCGNGLSVRTVGQRVDVTGMALLFEDVGL